MEINLLEREAQLDELNQFLRDTEKTLGSVLGVLEWDGDTLRKEMPEMITCPLNKEHRLPEAKLEKHLTTCSWRSEGYHEDHVPLPESCGPGGSSIMLDKETRTAVIREALAQDPTLKSGLPAVGLDDRPTPKTADRMTSDFTVDERRVLYDYAVRQTAAMPSVKVEDLDMPFKKEQKERPKTYLERLAAERDAKRRKVSKKVHTNRKSQTEILREVINNQMEAYGDYLKQEFPEIRKSPDQSYHTLIDEGSPSSKRASAERGAGDGSRRMQIQHSRYIEEHVSIERQSYRRMEYDKREEQNSYRSSNTYRKDTRYENRRDDLYKKYPQNDRYEDGNNARSKMYDTYTKHRRQDSEDSLRRHRDRSISYDSEKRYRHRDNSNSYESRSDRHHKSRSSNYKSHSNERCSDRSSIYYETQGRKRYEDRSTNKEEKRKDNSDMEEDYGESRKSQSNGSDTRVYNDVGSVSPQSFYTTLDNIKSETEDVPKQNESFNNTSKNKELEYYNRRSKREICESENNSDSNSRKSRSKGKHKRKKHKKHKKHHKKSVQKSDELIHTSDDFSC